MLLLLLCCYATVTTARKRRPYSRRAARRDALIGGGGGLVTPPPRHRRVGQRSSPVTSAELQHTTPTTAICGQAHRYQDARTSECTSSAVPPFPAHVQPHKIAR